jgi:release factor glutamine methyltransferase
MTINEAVTYGKDLLLSVFEADLPELDCEEKHREAVNNVYIMLSHILKKSIPQLKFDSSAELKDPDLNLFNSWLERRLSMEPVQYIVGETEFWSMPFYVGKGVLIPRQDTETLVYELKKQFKDPDKPYNFLDMGCGSGCIGISLLSIFPKSTVTFVDKDPTALVYTKKNLKRHSLTERARIISSDMFTELTSTQNPKENKFDAITSNPPYIPEDDLKSLSIQITLFEPISALRAGRDGLDFYRIFAAKADRFLKPNAPLFLEIGYYHAEEVKSIFASKAWLHTEVFMDLGNNPRVLVARKD